MLPLTLKFKKKERIAIKEFLKYEEPRVIRRANILNCLRTLTTAWISAFAGMTKEICGYDEKNWWL